jgi:hypothetical protein
VFSFFVNCAMQKDPQICLKYFLVSIFHFNQYKVRILVKRLLRLVARQETMMM